MEASCIPSYSPDPCDNFDTQFGVLTLRSSIRTSRKRRLHELYCLATQVDSLPHVGSIADDSPFTTAEESRFHDDNTVLQYD